MKSNQIIGLSFLAFIFICSGILATWQINWLNQASQTKLLSAQQDMALDATKLIEQSNVDLASILADPDQYKTIVLDQTKIVMRLTKNTEFNPSLSKTNWTYIIQDMPVAPNLGNRAISNTLERYLPNTMFYVIHDEKNPNEVIVDLYELDLNLFSQLVMSHFDSQNYYYRWVLNRKFTTTSSHASIGEVADLVIPLSVYLREPKRFSDFGRNNNTNKKEGAKDVRNESFKANIFWIYETVLRSFQFNSEDFKPDINSPFHYDNLDFSIEVFNLDQSLAQSVKTQKVLLTILSLAILTLLTVTAFFLFYAMHRSQNQRKLEQEFIATVNHELRTPLTVIQSAADNLCEGFVTKPESIMRYGSEIKSQSLRLNRMIESTLLYSGMPSQSKPNVETIVTQSFFNDVLSPLIQLAKNSQFLFEKNIINMPEQFQMDANALRMIIENLIMNSIIHGKSENSNNKINLSIELIDNQTLCISIADNGTGINKKEQKKVFNAFVRGKKSEQQQHPGSGLGLNLIKRMVKVLSGHIVLESPYLNDHNQLLPGTKFTVKLPINMQSTPVQSKSSQSKSSESK